MAETKDNKPQIFFAIFLIVVALSALVYFARDVARGTRYEVAPKLSQLREMNAELNEPVETRTTTIRERSGAENSTVSPAADWLTYNDKDLGYQLRFPNKYRMRLIASKELVSPLPGEVILAGVVVVPSLSRTNEAIPHYAYDTLTVLITDWPSFGNSQNFLNQAYVNSSVPKDQIQAFALNGRLALRLTVNSDRASVNATHTEILIAGPGSRVIKIIYWPADNPTFAAIASTVSVQ